MQKLSLDQFKNIYLTDRVAEEDQFDHKHFSEILWRIIQDKTIGEDRTPFNIGIFGKWGVGKSTVVKLLEKKIGEWNLQKKLEKEYEFIEFKVWKFSKDALKRKFIFTIGKKLDSAGLEDLNKRVRADKSFSYSFFSNPRIFFDAIKNQKNIPWKHITVASVVITLLNLAILSSLYFLNKKIFQSIVDIYVVFSSYLLGLLPAFFEYLKRVIQDVKVNVTFAKYDSDEQFEEEFISLIEKSKKIKIIFIDDLDRCPEEKVIEALETIKTYLDVKTCIFIIACDDEVIKRVVLQKRQELFKDGTSSDYLQKFFQYSVRIPPFIHQNMRDYAKKVLLKQNNDLRNLDMIDDILESLIYEDVISPRKAISLLNGFAVDFETVLKREESLKLRPGEVTSNLPALAVFTVVKSDFPLIYDLLIHDSELMKFLIDAGENKNRFSDEYHKQIVEKCKGTKDYHRFVRFFDGVKEFVRDVDDFTPFIYMDADKNCATLKSERQKDLYHYFRTGQEEQVRKIVEDLKTEEDRVSYFTVMKDRLEQLRTVREKRSALKVIFSVSDLLPEAMNKSLFGHKVAGTFIEYTKGNQKWVEEFKLSGVLGVFQHVNSSKRQEVVESFIDSLCSTAKSELAVQLLDAIFQYENLILDETSINRVREVLTRLKSEAATPAGDVKVFFDLNQICDLICAYENHPAALAKFIPGERIDELVVFLIDEDKNNKEHIAKSNAYRAFEIADALLLSKNIPRRIEKQIAILKTQRLYVRALEIFKQIINEIPESLNASVVSGLIQKIPSCEKSELGVILGLIDDISYRLGVKPNTGLNDLTSYLPLKMYSGFDPDSFIECKKFLTRISDQRLAVETSRAIFKELFSHLDLMKNIEYTKAIITYVSDNTAIPDEVSKLELSSNFARLLYDPHSYDKAAFPSFEGFDYLEKIEGMVIGQLAANKNILVKMMPAASLLNPGAGALPVNILGRVVNIIDKYWSAYDEESKKALGSYLISGVNSTDVATLRYFVDKIYSKDVNSEFELLEKSSVDLLVNYSVKAIKLLDETAYRVKVLKILSKRNEVLRALGGTYLAVLLQGIQDQFLPDGDHEYACESFLERLMDYEQDRQILIVGMYLGSRVHSADKNKKIVASIAAMQKDDEDRKKIIEKYCMGLFADEKAWTFVSVLISAVIKPMELGLKKDLSIEYFKKIKAKGEEINIARNRFSLIIHLRLYEVFEEADVYSMFSDLFNTDEDDWKELAYDLLLEYYKELNKIPRKLRPGYKIMIEQSVERAQKEATREKLSSLIKSNWVIFQ